MSPESNAPEPPEPAAERAGDAGALEQLLVQRRAELVGWVQKEARGLLAYESAEDVAQGILLRALGESERFEYRSEAAFGSWLYTLARRYVADRHDYWSAVRRGSGRVLRMTFSGGETGVPRSGVVAPPAAITGPSTFAARREVLVLAAQAMAALPERDRQLVQWMSEGLSIDEQAESLGASYAATQRAGLRAVERFRKSFHLVSQSQASEGPGV